MPPAPPDPVVAWITPVAPRESRKRTMSDLTGGQRRRSRSPNSRAPTAPHHHETRHPTGRRCRR